MTALPAARRAPLVVAVSHNKGGVGKTTTTLIVAKFLARRWKVAMRDYDESFHLTELVKDLAPDGALTRRLWLQQGEGGPRADVVLIDSAPARGPETRRALLDADYVLIPAPPEHMAVRAFKQMLNTIEFVRAERSEGNPFLAVLGVVPTLFDTTWPSHHAYLEEIRAECAARRVRVFPPIPRRHSYSYLSTAGQDYRPVADAIDALLAERAPRPRPRGAVHAA